jgi:hypothetical protein
VQDTKTREERVRVDHAWNVHLSAATRDNTDSLMLLLKGGLQPEDEQAEGKAEAAVDDSDDSYSTVDPQALIAAAGEVKVLSTAAMLGPLIPCIASEDGHEDDSTPQQGPGSNTIHIPGCTRSAAESPAVGSADLPETAAVASVQDIISTVDEAPTAPQHAAAAQQLRHTNSIHTNSSNSPTGMHAAPGTAQQLDNRTQPLLVQSTAPAGEPMGGGWSAGATQSSTCRSDIDSLRPMLGEFAVPARAPSPAIEGACGVLLCFQMASTYTGS